MHLAQPHSNRGDSFEGLAELYLGKKIRKFSEGAILQNSFFHQDHEQEVAFKIRSKLLGCSLDASFKASLQQIYSSFFSLKNESFKPLNVTELSLKKKSTDLSNCSSEGPVLNYNLLAHLKETHSQDERFLSYLQMIEEESGLFASKSKILPAIKRYQEKRANRMKNHKIRYKVRQQLAEKRLRVKGKFVKNKKLNLEKLMKEYIDTQNLQQFEK